jgi:iron-sulfur cluster repair protein YtfE (RIC family)
MQEELTTIADFAISRPGSIATLEKLKIDYCCKGRQPIADACRPACVTP